MIFKSFFALKKASKKYIILNGVDWMKTKSKKMQVIIAAVCILTVAAGVIFAVKYIKKSENPPVITTLSESVSEIQSMAVVIPTEKTTENKTEKDETESDSKKKTILNYPKSENDYTPTAFEAKLFNAINSKREENALPLLNWSDCLHTLAKERADESLTLFSHTRPGGKKPSSVLTEKDISFTLFGECLLKGTKENDEGVNLLINGLLKEKDQSDMVLSKDYSYASVAVSLDGNGNVNAVILFCNP